MVDCLPTQNADLAIDVREGDFRVEVDAITESEWCALLDQFVDANIYQTWAYGAVRWQEKNLSHLVLKRGSTVVAMAQLRVVCPANLPMGVAYIRWGPLCHRRDGQLDLETLQVFASALRDEYVVRRGLYLEILPNAFAGSSRAELFQSALSTFEQESGLSDEDYRTFVLDLSPTLDELRKGFHRRWRNHLNAAEKNDLEIVEGNDSSHFAEFCLLYQQMWERKKFSTGVSIEEFSQIQERLPENQRLRVLICRDKGKPVAAVVCAVLGNSAIYLLGATNEDGMKLKGSYALQWAAIQSLKQSGVRWYDLGAIDPIKNPGVYHFKSGLSGVDVSHIGAFNACDSLISGAVAKSGQVLQQGLRKLLHPMS